jgi:hypothetical protein
MPQGQGRIQTFSRFMDTHLFDVNDELEEGSVKLLYTRPGGFTVTL